MKAQEELQKAGWASATLPEPAKPEGHLLFRRCFGGSAEWNLEADASHMEPKHVYVFQNGTVADLPAGNLD